MRTAVINLTRFGDLLQTQPLLTGLTSAGDSVELICLESFRSAATLLGDITTIHSFPDNGISPLIDSGWPHALKALSGWLQSVNAAPWDRVVNLTPGLPARLLSRCITAKTIDGFGMDEHGFSFHSSPWAAFLQAAAAYRGCNPFNLVDLFQRLAGLAPGPFSLPGPSSDALGRAHELLRGLVGRRLVGLQLGASQEFRQWPVHSFVRAAEVLWRQTQTCPVLLGTAAESHLAEEFGRLADYPFLDLTGKTDLPVLTAVLSQMDVLVTNDTGTMHLAAGLGVQVVAIFLATAQPFDTGPYCEGAISLEPDLPCHPCSFGAQCPHGLECRRRVDGEIVGRIAAQCLNVDAAASFSGKGVRVWRACRDRHNFMSLVSLSGHGGEDRAVWIGVQREIYRQFLDQKWGRMELPVDWKRSDFTDQMRQDVERCLLLVTLIEEQGRLLSVRPHPSLQQKLLLNCQNLHDVFTQSLSFGVLGLMWRDLSAVQSRSMDGFVGLCTRFRELLTKFLDSLPLA